MILQYMVGNKEVYQDSDAISVAKIKLDDNGKTLNDVLALIEEEALRPLLIVIENCNLTIQ